MPHDGGDGRACERFWFPLLNSTLPVEGGLLEGEWPLREPTETMAVALTTRGLNHDHCIPQGPRWATRPRCLVRWNGSM